MPIEFKSPKMLKPIRSAQLKCEPVAIILDYLKSIKISAIKTHRTNNGRLILRVRNIYTKHVEACKIQWDFKQVPKQV